MLATNLFKENKSFILPYLVWLVFGAIAQLQISADELFFFFNRTFVHSISDYFFFIISGFGRGDTIAIVLIALLLFKYFRTKYYILVGSTFGVLIPLMVQSLKTYYDCPRPPTVFGLKSVHIPSLITPLYAHSFPSGHSIGAFGLAALLSFLLVKKWRHIGFLFFLLALLAGISRMYLGVHFFKDVYFGSILGFSLSFCIVLFYDYLLKIKYEE